MRPNEEPTVEPHNKHSSSTLDDPEGSERSRTVAVEPLGPVGAAFATAFPAPQSATEDVFGDSRKAVAAGGLGRVVVFIVWCQRRNTRGRQAGGASHSHSQEWLSPRVVASRRALIACPVGTTNVSANKLFSVHHAVREHRASVEHRAGVRRPPTPTLPQQTPFLDKQIFPTHKNDRAAAACFKGVEARSKTTRRVAGLKRTIVTAFGAVTALVTAALIVAVALIRALAAAAVGYNTCTCVKITGR